jgi:hypothetical protein
MAIQGGAVCAPRLGGEPFVKILNHIPRAHSKTVITTVGAGVAHSLR